jgi:hypothetical protein
MNWTELLNAARVTEDPPDKAELDNYRSIVALRLSDINAVGLSDEQRFIIAYDAARTLSLMVVRASGYRPRKAGFHFNTLKALAAADPTFDALSGYFDLCRSRRNDSEYDFAGGIGKTDADDLVSKVTQFRLDAEAWITAKDPALA